MSAPMPPKTRRVAMEFTTSVWMIFQQIQRLLASRGLSAQQVDEACQAIVITAAFRADDMGNTVYLVEWR